MTKPLFLFGTLRDRALLNTVAGAEVQATDAVLEGYEARRVQDADYPCLVPGNGSAQGLVVSDQAAQERLDYYEGGYGYGVRPVTVTTEDGPLEAEVYWPDQALTASDDPFDLSAWQAQWGQMTLYAAQEAMEYFGQISPEVLASRFGQIRGRAWSRVQAEKEPRVTELPGRPKGTPRIETYRRPYTHYFSLVEHDLTFPQFDGTQSATVNRAAFLAADAVVVLPYDPVRDRVLLIEQFRSAMFMRGDPDVFSIEAIAGRLDPGETAEEAARREAIEEAGLHLRDLHFVSTNYPSPGAMTEYLTLFVATVDLPDGIEGIGGLSTEDENIRSHLFDYATFEDWLDRDQFRNGPLILLGHWLARHRAQMRKGSA